MALDKREKDVARQAYRERVQAHVCGAEDGSLCPACRHEVNTLSDGALMARDEVRHAVEDYRRARQGGGA